MENALSTAEQTELKPFLLQMYEEWMEKGEEKGMLAMLFAFMQNDPNMDNTAVANLFNVSIEMVMKARKMLSEQ